jgi:hypothetical protein
MLSGRRQALQAELESGGATRAQSSAEAAAALKRQAVTLKRAGKLQEARDVLRRAKAMEAQPAAAASAAAAAGNEGESLESEFMALQAEVEGRGPAVQVVGELGGWADTPVEELLVDAGNSLSPSGVAADLNSPDGTHRLERLMPSAAESQQIGRAHV